MRSRSTRSTPTSWPSARCAPRPCASSRATSPSTRTTRRCCCGRWATSSPPGRAPPRPPISPPGGGAAPPRTAPDPSRPVGLAFAGYRTALCQAPSYAPLDVLGINDYFGWYVGPSGQIFDRTLLPGYLDAWRACYPKQATIVSEFGAEANRDGPAEEKGTFAYQQGFANYQLGVFATKPWL